MSGGDGESGQEDNADATPMRDGMAEGNKGLKPLANKMRRQQRAADWVGASEPQSGDCEHPMAIAGTNVRQKNGKTMRCRYGITERESGHLSCLIEQ